MTWWFDIHLASIKWHANSWKRWKVNFYNWKQGGSRHLFELKLYFQFWYLLPNINAPDRTAMKKDLMLKVLTWDRLHTLPEVLLANAGLLKISDLHNFSVLLKTKVKCSKQERNISTLTYKNSELNRLYPRNKGN